MEYLRIHKVVYHPLEINLKWLHVYILNYTAGKISIEHITIFLSKYISKGAVDMKLSPDACNNLSNPYTQTKQNKYIHQKVH